MISADDMILFVENHKDSTKKLLELINEFSKGQDTKSTHKNHEPTSLQGCGSQKR